MCRRGRSERKCTNEVDEKLDRSDVAFVEAAKTQRSSVANQYRLFCRGGREERQSVPCPLPPDFPLILRAKIVNSLEPLRLLILHVTPLQHVDELLDVEAAEGTGASE
jgi:hypothetical protein